MILEVVGDKPSNMPNWLWDFDAKPISEEDKQELKSFEIKSKRGFRGSLYKTDGFIEQHPFGTVPAGFVGEGRLGVFESNSILRAVARECKDKSLYGGDDLNLTSRIDSFLDANLVFSREFQVYILELEDLNEYTHSRTTSAYEFYLEGIEASLSINDYLVKTLDGLVITGGNFDISPTLYSKTSDGSRNIKNKRTNFEIEIFKKFLQTSKPILGICGGEQLMNVATGGDLIQDIRTSIGPLRESINRGLSRTNLVITIGEISESVKEKIPKHIPLIAANFKIKEDDMMLKGQSVTAFAGIAYPEKFFNSLKLVKANIIDTISYSDHHIYSEDDLLHLAEIANKNKSILVTTKKDIVRIPKNFRSLVKTIDGFIELDDEKLLLEILSNLIENKINQ